MSRRKADSRCRGVSRVFSPVHCAPLHGRPPLKRAGRLEGEDQPLERRGTILHASLEIYSSSIIDDTCSSMWESLMKAFDNHQSQLQARVGWRQRAKDGHVCIFPSRYDIPIAEVKRSGQRSQRSASNSCSRPYRSRPSCILKSQSLSRLIPPCEPGILKIRIRYSYHILYYTIVLAQNCS